MTTQEIGDLGEELSVLWLRRNGYKILSRNHQADHGGEVDIVCRLANTLCFVEVKSRTVRDPVHRPRDAVTADKQRLITKGARDWLRHLPKRNIAWRYDIVEVLLLEGELPEITHVVDAFREPG